MRYLYQPAERRRIFGYGEGRRNVARAGETVDLSDDEAAHQIATVRGVDGAPCLIPVDVESAPVVEPDAPAVEVAAEGDAPKPKRRRGRPRKSSEG